MLSIHRFMFLLALSTTANCLPIYWDWGPCPQVTTKSDFSVANYLGTWYQIARYAAFFQPNDERCTQATYTESDLGENYINVYNRGLRPDGTVSDIQGVAWIPDASEPGKLLVKFSEYMPAGDYWVLDTDYDTYSLVHTCSNFYLFHTQIDWILARDRSLEDSTLNTIYGILERQGVSKDPFAFTNQNGCDDLL